MAVPRPTSSPGGIGYFAHPNLAKCPRELTVNSSESDRKKHPPHRLRHRQKAVKNPRIYWRFQIAPRGTNCPSAAFTGQTTQFHPKTQSPRPNTARHQKSPPHGPSTVQLSPNRYCKNTKSRNRSNLYPTSRRCPTRSKPAPSRNRSEASFVASTPATITCFPASLAR